nr:YdaS family helix-turn-helix protein [Solemya velesiana gill symbiont]
MEVFNTTQKHLRRAIDLVGGQSALARAINSKQQNVWFWLNESGRVPAEFVLSFSISSNFFRRSRNSQMVLASGTLSCGVMLRKRQKL